MLDWGRILLFRVWELWIKPLRNIISLFSVQPRFCLRLSGQQYVHMHVSVRAQKSQVLWEESHFIKKKPLNSQMVHPVLLEGVGPRAYVLCNWYGSMRWMQMGFLRPNSPVCASSENLLLGCSQHGGKLFGCSYWVE